MVGRIMVGRIMVGNSIQITRPDDWHVHLRDGELLATVLADTARVFARAIVMPNLKPPVLTAADARAYRARIEAALEPASDFLPLMTCYLNDATDPEDLRTGFMRGDFVAAKLYPIGATTNSDLGVRDLGAMTAVFETMQSLQMPLLIHGEIADPDIDIFDREAVFIERMLEPLCKDFPELRIVLEHVSTSDGVSFVRSQDARIAATITPHHLMINRNAMFQNGLRPHYYCLPVAKRETHRQALRAAATSGERQFFLGTDSAPHLRSDKESACGCAGIYNAPLALACYAQVFAEENRLEHLAGFAAHFGADYYGLERNESRITLRRCAPCVLPDRVVDSDRIATFNPPQALEWEIAS